MNANILNKKETIIDMNNKHWYNVKDSEGIIDRT